MVHALTSSVVARCAREAHGDTAGAEAPRWHVLQRDLSSCLDGCSLESCQADRAAIVAQVVQAESLNSTGSAAHWSILLWAVLHGRAKGSPHPTARGGHHRHTALLTPEAARLQARQRTPPVDLVRRGGRRSRIRNLRPVARSFRHVDPAGTTLRGPEPTVRRWTGSGCRWDCQAANPQTDDRLANGTE